MRAAYSKLRESARKRRLNFCLPFWYFEAFALRCEYIEKGGNTAASVTVDRINNRIGYVLGNIQPMTRAENAIKQAKSDERRMKYGYSWQARY